MLAALPPWLGRGACSERRPWLLFQPASSGPCGARACPKYTPPTQQNVLKIKGSALLLCLVTMLVCKGFASPRGLLGALAEKSSVWKPRSCNEGPQSLPACLFPVAAPCTVVAPSYCLVKLMTITIQTVRGMEKEEPHAVAREKPLSGKGPNPHRRGSKKTHSPAAHPPKRWFGLAPKRPSARLGEGQTGPLAPGRVFRLPPAEPGNSSALLWSGRPALRLMCHCPCGGQRQEAVLARSQASP